MVFWGEGREIPMAEILSMVQCCFVNGGLVIVIKPKYFSLSKFGGTRRMRKSILFVCLACLLSSSIAMGAVQFDLTKGSAWGSFAMERNYNEGGIGLKVTGWTQAAGDSGTISQQTMGRWSGLGVEPDNAGHAIDNGNGFDMLLLCFDQAVYLDSIRSGWKGNDSDATVMVHTSGTFTNPSGRWEDLLTNGWTEAGDYANLATGSDTEIMPGLPKVASQYWLVGAYNPDIKATNNYPYGGIIGMGYDSFKLHTATVTPAVPVPGSLALVALGMAGVHRIRRRRWA